MLESDIKKIFHQNHIPSFAKFMEKEGLRLYGKEFPIKTSDGEKYIDILLHIQESVYRLSDYMMVLEFKNDKVDYQSAVAQTLRYMDHVQARMYCKTVEGCVVAPDFSHAEIKLANDYGIKCIQYDHINGTFSKKNQHLDLWIFCLILLF